MMSRGDRREEIVHTDADRRLFVETLAQACAKTGWQVHAFCLMTNHFHCVLETPRANLVVGMKWLLGTYTMRFNARHGLRGHLFSGRYKSLLVDGASGTYLRTVCDYVHLNPVRAGLVAARQKLERHPWSSYPCYLQTPGRRPAWMRVDRLLAEHGIRADSPRGRFEFARRMEAQRREPQRPEELAPLRRGWLLGGEDFLTRLLDRLEGKFTEHHKAVERSDTNEEKAERLISRHLREEGWTEKTLTSQRKGHPVKVRLAQLLREQTTVSLKWIANRLQMGTWTHVSNLLYHSK